MSDYVGVERRSEQTNNWHGPDRRHESPGFGKLTPEGEVLMFVYRVTFDTGRTEVREFQNADGSKYEAAYAGTERRTGKPSGYSGPERRNQIPVNEQDGVPERYGYDRDSRYYGRSQKQVKEVVVKSGYRRNTNRSILILAPDRHPATLKGAIEAALDLPMDDEIFIVAVTQIDGGSEGSHVLVAESKADEPAGQPNDVEIRSAKPSVPKWSNPDVAKRPAREER